MNKPKVLYIEDNFDNRLLVKRVLLAEGFEFLEAEDAQSGIRLAAEERPDLILMDINLPEVDGLTATARLRELPGMENVPIIALTANVMKGDMERTLEAGCDGYISKPIDVDKLPQQLIEFWRNKRHGR